LTVSGHQLLLPFSLDESGLKALLEQLTGRPLCLVITDNRTSMLSVRKTAGCVTVRVHRIFLSAGKSICREIAEFIGGGQCNSRLLRAFFRQKRPALTQKNYNVRHRPTGQTYCLKSIYEKLNAGYFDGAISASVTWGRISTKQRVKMRTLGSFNFETNTIRINPVLDRKTVPAYFVEFVVYHEMLHAWLGIKSKNGRRSVHSKEFRLHEKKFREYAKALEWEQVRFGRKHQS
jgi:predicted SprT family Zn-dependent metalloprotease